MSKTILLGRYNVEVEKTFRIFSSFADADAADLQARRDMSHEDRIKTVIELRDRRHPDAVKQGLARVCRIIELHRS